jgi:DNA mismatch endonuclease (patch repair protein)
MADTRNAEQRRRIMQAVGTRDTGPELAVRRMLHGMGYRYRLQARDLPGRPDVVFRSRKKVIFVHGCFWHGHRCRKGRAPKSRLEYWGPKLAANRARDKAQVRALRKMGWSVLTIWQCQTANVERLRDRLVGFLEEGA